MIKKEITYNEFKELDLKFEDLTYEKMVWLWCINSFSDGAIAEKCKVSKTRITYLRTKKYGILQYNFFRHIQKVLGITNKFREEANTIVAYAFRNTDLEVLHSGKHSKILEDPKYSRITNEEIKKLMVESCDKVEELLRLKQENPQGYEIFMSTYSKMYCSNWKK